MNLQSTGTRCFPQVALVGAGPGDPGLITLRARELLRSADVVIYDSLVNPALLRFAPDGAELVFGGKHDPMRGVTQQDINALLLHGAHAGQRVVRLKGGDPYLFGRGGEEAELLAQAGISFEVVPGISSCYAVPAYGGIPLLDGVPGSGITVVTGHENPFSPEKKTLWKQLANIHGTLVILMGLKNLRAIAEILIQYGRPPGAPVSVISQGTTPYQQTVTGTLASIASAVESKAIVPPAITVIGQGTNELPGLNWYEKRSLLGRRVVVTQRADLVAPTVAALQNCGAEVWHIPATRWGPPVDLARLDQALAVAPNYDWILFSHPFAIDYFFQRHMELHGDMRKLGSARLGAYGPLCGEKIREWHLRPAAVSADHKTPLIMQSILNCGPVQNQKFLVVRGDKALELVPEALEQLGARVDVVSGFSTRAETEDPLGFGARLRQEGADWIVFATAMAIEHFHAQFDLPGLLAEFPKTRLLIAKPDIQWALDKLGVTGAVVGGCEAIEMAMEAQVVNPVTDQDTFNLLRPCYP